MTKKKIKIMVNDAGYYMARNILEGLLRSGKITQDEYAKIDKLNQRTFNPDLVKVMG